METYKDSEGTEIQAEQLSGPTLLNTIFGEICAEEGDWRVTLPDNRVVVYKDNAFRGSFTLV